MSQRVICEVRFDAGLEEFFQTMTGASAENLSVTQEQPVTLLDCERSYIPTGTHPPYGMLKGWMGSTHFLTGILNQVSTEMSLHMLACNLKPLINTPRHQATSSGATGMVSVFTVDKKRPQGCAGAFMVITGNKL
jgi:hypothetical protein